MKFKLLIDQLNTSETKTRPRLPQISAIFDKSDLNKSVSLLLILYEKHQSAEITKSISTVGSGSKLCEEITRQKSYLSTIFREFISKLCSKNTVWVLDQMCSLAEKWVISCNHCLILSGKLLTELFDRFAACTEGAKHLTEFLELLITHSANCLSNLKDQLHSVEHYLQPVYADDYSRHDARYTAKCVEQFTKLRDSAKQTLNETKNIWTVKRSSIREAIGLNADGYAVYLGEQKVLDPQETRNPGRTPSLGALSAVLRLNCPTRNVTQPLFYQALRRNLADEMEFWQ
ncbi:hypothetical protein FBUS_00443 [Fasciolopsis buskii]|uniref:Uncharacterized protein n=1 Tax=Fasciolopsis buskii TaxID=27845 RepID=A0A8E0S112_9TREM|nr:hypothetical protein FBUS_00443 [Fasciolopsis buski]